MRMNTFRFLLAGLVAGSSALSAFADAKKARENKETRPPVSIAPAPPRSEKVFVYEHKPVAGRPVLVHPEQAQKVVDQFKAAYPGLGSPRILIYVNRDLIDEEKGFKLIARTEKVETSQEERKSDFQADPNFKGGESRSNGLNLSAGGNVTVSGDVRAGPDIYPGRGETSARREKTLAENRYRRESAKELSLADKQTVRDVERLFGRPLRAAGVTLVDQRVATQLIPQGAFKSLATEGDQARRDREALSKISDVVLEVLISPREIPVAEISGDKLYSVPDIQATAIRLSDSKILGQASSSDIIGKERYASYIVRNFDVREIAEATALALMEDMLTGSPSQGNRPDSDTK